MTSTPVHCRFTEGSVSVPPGYRDKTINLFTSTQPDAASISISRDTLKADQSAESYISEQLAILEKQMKNWRQQSRQPVPASDNLPAGESVCCSFSSGGRNIWQCQSVFVLENQQILVFTLTRPAPLQPSDHQLLSDLLAGFTLSAPQA